MELVFDPVSNKGRPVRPVKQRSLALQRIVLKIPFVVNSIWVYQPTIAIFHAMLNHPLKMSLILIGLHNEHTFIFILSCQLVLAERIFSSLAKQLNTL